MARHWTAAEFLSFINARVCYKDGDVCVKYSDTEQEAPRTRHELTFVQPIDLIIEGYCPYAEGRDAQREWFRSTLDRAQPKSVGVFPGCCKEYPQYYQAMLRSIAPDIQWHFPKMCDLEGEFGDDIGTVAAIQHLMDAGMLGPNEAVSEQDVAPLCIP